MVQLHDIGKDETVKLTNIVAIDCQQILYFDKRNLL